MRRSLPDSLVLKQVILKVAQRCNLDCTYCYVYNRGDDSWKTRPAVISERVAQALADRIREHCALHRLRCFTVELHGGEPLLLGKRRMRRLLEILTERAGVELRFTLQTNGVLLDLEWVELLARFGVSFGISLDGPPETADRRRVMRKDRSGSTQRVIDTIHRLSAATPLFEPLFGGCLCVIDPDGDGAEFVDWFVDQGIAAFDFLLPDGNRANPPEGWTGPEPYRRFLLSAFERWYAMGERAPRVRKFEQMLAGLMGGRVNLDALGGALEQLCVVESDGSIGVSDVARLCGGDFSTDLMTIFDQPLDAHAEGYGLGAIQQVSAQCARCPHLSACGGGYLPHRFDGEGFDNPSLYCEALYGLAERMMLHLRRDLPAHLWSDPPAAAIAPIPEPALP